jgi:hypothetical protein
MAGEDDDSTSLAVSYETWRQASLQALDAALVTCAVAAWAAGLTVADPERFSEAPRRDEPLPLAYPGLWLPDDQDDANARWTRAFSCYSTLKGEALKAQEKPTPSREDVDSLKREYERITAEYHNHLGGDRPLCHAYERAHELLGDSSDWTSTPDVVLASYSSYIRALVSHS